MSSRGSYAKGVAKREEILSTALEVVHREGVSGASVRQIADAVGLSQAGLLHYFDSKEELFTEILRKRDEVDMASADSLFELDLRATIKQYLALVRHNAEVPGAVELFSRGAVDAADPNHPAHEFFIARSTRIREHLSAVIRRAQEEGLVDESLDPEMTARLVQAAMDGLQLQWLQEPSIDMSATLQSLFSLILSQPDQEL